MSRSKGLWGIDEKSPFFFELEALCNGLAEGELGLSELGRLEDLLQESDEALRFYVKFFNMHHAITTSSGKIECLECLTLMDEKDSTDPDEVNSTTEIPCGFPSLESLLNAHETDMIQEGLEGNYEFKTNSPFGDTSSIPIRLFQVLGSPIPLGILMLCLFLVPFLGISWVIWNESPKLSAACPISGRVSRAIACVWDNSKGHTLSDNGVIVNNQLYTLKSGFLQLDLNSGAQVVIEGPATFSTESSMRLSLLQGRLATEIPPKAKNFTVVAGGLDLVDRGTAFGIDLNGKDKASVHIFEGSVDAFTQNQGLNPEKLQSSMVAGQAFSVNRLNGEFEKEPIDESRFIRTIDSNGGLVPRLANPSFEYPPSEGSSEPIPCWNVSNSVLSLPIASLQPSFLSISDNWGRTFDSDDEQVLELRLHAENFDSGGMIRQAWAYQFMGIPTTEDIGKILTLKAIAVRHLLPGQVAPRDDSTIASIAFTTSTTAYHPGSEVDKPGSTARLFTEGEDTVLRTRTTILSSMVGQKLYARILVRNSKLNGQNDLIRFDHVDLKVLTP